MVDRYTVSVTSVPFGNNHCSVIGGVDFRALGAGKIIAGMRRGFPGKGVFSRAVIGGDPINVGRKRKFKRTGIGGCLLYTSPFQG